MGAAMAFVVPSRGRSRTSAEGQGQTA